MAAEPEVGVDPLQQRPVAHRLQPSDFVGYEGLIANVGERGPSPECQGAAQQRRAEQRVAGGIRSAPLGDQPLERRDVHVGRLDLQQVASAVRGDPDARRKLLAQLGDVDVEELRRGRRGRLAPQRIDQLVGIGDLPPPDRQSRQQRPVFRGRDRRAVDLDRPEQPE